MQGMNVISFEDATLAWVSNREPRLSASTERAYRGEVDRLAQFFAVKHGGFALGDFTKVHWEDYLHELQNVRKHVVTCRKKPLAPNSALQAMRISAAFLRWARDQGLLTWAPTANHATNAAKLPRVERRSALVDLSRAPDSMHPALEAILRNPPAADAGLNELRAQLVVCLAYWAGLRSGDIAALRIADMSIDGTTVKVCHPRLRSVVTIQGNVAVILKKYLFVREEAGEAVNQRSPIIAALDSNKSISTWSVWALIAQHIENVTGIPRHHSAQSLRRTRVATMGARYVDGINELASYTHRTSVDFYTAPSG
jgi:site-specific recombinase XerD